MTTKRWFLPESPDLLAMLHNQAAITVQAMDALVAWSNGDTTAVRWSAQVPLQHRLARTYRSGPLFLADDVAHTHSPAGGQGMNTGLQDATNLGWKLAYALQGADSVGTTTLLDSYQLERRPVARHVMTLTNVAFWAEAGTDPLARAARTIAATIGPPSNQASTSSSNATPSRQTPAPSPNYARTPTHRRARHRPPCHPARRIRRLLRRPRRHRRTHRLVRTSLQRFTDSGLTRVDEADIVTHQLQDGGEDRSTRP
jgi:hypothetical protein